MTTTLINTAGKFAGHHRASAPACYAIRQANTAELLRRLTAAIEAHRVIAEARPGDWSLPADLARVEGMLAEALATLGDRSGVNELGMEY